MIAAQSRQRRDAPPTRLEIPAFSVNNNYGSFDEDGGGGLDFRFDLEGRSKPITVNKLGSHRKRFKIQRALGLELPGLGKAGALERRNYPPGQHGKTTRRKASPYGQQLREKQKLLFHYCLREEQLRRFVRQAQRLQSSDWMASLISLLERRLDNVVFRLGYARSILAARQLVSHGHVVVNGRKQTIGSMVLRVGSRVQLTAASNQFEATKVSRGAPRLAVPSFLTLEVTDTSDAGIVTSEPNPEHVPFEFKPSLVAEYYAKRGV